MSRAKFSFLLLFSLVVNVTLVVWVLGFPGAESAAVVEYRLGSANGVSHEHSSRGGGEIATSVETVKAKPGPTLWQELQKLSPEALRDRLRAAGYPRQFVNQAVLERLNDLYLEPFRSTNRKNEVLPYWRNAAPASNGLTPEEIKATDLYTAEATRLLGRFFYFSDEQMAQHKSQMYGEISNEKFEKVLLAEDRASLEYPRLSGVKDPVEREMEFARIQKERQSQIEAILSPAELFEYELRQGGPCSVLRMQTEFFPLDEAEFRTFGAVYLDAYRRAGLENAVTPEDRKQLNEALRADIDAKLRASMGEERFADFQQARDPENVKLNRIVKRLDLPLAAAREVVSLKNDIVARADAVKANTSLNADEKSASLAVLAQEAEQRIGTTLTPRGLAAYKQYDGKWLKALQQNAGKR